MAGETLGFHSLHEEVATELPVEGELPSWLSGSLIRNGPGAFGFEDVAVKHWFDGLAMLQKYTFDGDGVAYRNRLLRTEAYEAAREGTFEGGFATAETTLRERLTAFLGPPYDNTNVIAERIDGQYLALTETPYRVAFDPTTLRVIGGNQYAGPEPNGDLACSHLRYDPATDVFVNFETEFGRTSQYHVHAVLGADERRHIGSIPVEEPAYMHSFALTPRFVVLTEFPFVIDPLAVLKPGRLDPFIEQFEWQPDRGTRFIVMDRTTGNVVAEPRTDALFGFHHANAYECAGGEELVIDLETVPDVSAIDSLYLDRLEDGSLDALAGRLERFRVRLDGLGGPRIDREEVYAGGTALPTVSPERWCRSHRYVYAQGTDRPVTEWPSTVIKIDTESGDAQEFRDNGNNLSEPIFVPHPSVRDGGGSTAGCHEDHGVVLTVALDAEARHSSLVVLDGESFEEVARASVPHAIPFDFHGRFFPEL
jgi:carotenoid cleavage dioxygenase-like enzyme